MTGDGKDGSFEARLDELRDAAAREGKVDAPGVRAAGGPLPAAGGPLPPSSAPRATRLNGAPGYYGRPVLKPPVWTWEIPVYFFVGGLAGGCAILAWAAQVAAPEAVLVRTALWLALGGTAASAVLLILDLGRPMRFLYMLRVFKWRSPMSVGVWVLTVFGGALALALAGMELARAEIAGGLAPVLLAAGLWTAAPLGALVATYTGVLIGATAVPAWNLHRTTLPIHFGIAGLGSAAAVLELLGFPSPALGLVGLAASVGETLVGLSVEVSRHGTEDRALREGRAGILLRGAGVLAGPASLVLRLSGMEAAAAVSFLVGALVSRFGWIEAGRASARDPGAALARYSG